MLCCQRTLRVRLSVLNSFVIVMTIVRLIEVEEEAKVKVKEVATKTFGSEN